MSNPTSSACDVLLVGLHRPTARRFCLPVREADEPTLRRFWKTLGFHCKTNDHALRDYTVSGLRKGGGEKWEHDARISEAVEMARPAVGS